MLIFWIDGTTALLSLDELIAMAPDPLQIHIFFFINLTETRYTDIPYLTFIRAENRYKDTLDHTMAMECALCSTFFPLDVRFIVVSSKPFVESIGRRLLLRGRNVALFNPLYSLSYWLLNHEFTLKTSGMMMNFLDRFMEDFYDFNIENFIQDNPCILSFFNKDNLQ